MTIVSETRWVYRKKVDRNSILSFIIPSMLVFDQATYL